MTLLFTLPAATPAPDWLGVAARPGSGLGLLPAALSVQPGATLGALLLAALAAVLAPRLVQPDGPGRRRRDPTPRPPA